MTMFRRLGLFACVSPIVASISWGSENEVAGYKKLTLQELMDLEVTSVSRRPEKLSGSASSVQVITHDDIRRSGATSIPEALRLATNLQVAQKNSASWAITARGFNTELSNKLLVLMDGRTLYSPLFSGVYWNAQDYLLEDLSRIEVISGPGGTLWGANAVNGVINITSKSARDTQGLFTEAAVGDELEHLAGVRYGGRLAPNVYFRIYGKYTERDGNVLADGSSTNTDWESKRGGFRIDALPSPQTTLTFQGDLYGINNDVPGDHVTMRGGNLLGRLTHTLDNDSEMSLQLYYDRTYSSQSVGPSIFSPLAGRFVDELDTYDLDFQHRLFFGERHKVVWGLGYRRTHDVVENTPGLGFAPARLDQDLYSAFVQDEVALGAGWAFTLGSKVEHNDYTGLEFEPSARLQWEFAPSHMIWTAVSRAVRMPSRVDRDLRQPSAGAPIFMGGPRFDSETVITYELGYRGQISPNLLVAVTAFYSDYNDLRSLGVTPVTGLPLLLENDVEGRSYGLELTTTYEVVKGWRLHAGYTILRTDLRVESGGIDLNNTLNETADPRHQFSLRSSVDLPHRVEFDVGLRWVDTLRINNSGAPATVPSYWELDARIAWHPTEDLELSLTGQSLLHDQHAEYGLPGPAREEIERSVYAKITWRY